MKRILKYPINLMGKTEIEIPSNAIFIDADEQHGALNVWAEVDETQPTKTVTLWSIMTGEERDDLDRLSHIRTVLCYTLVCHIYHDGY